MKYRPVFAYGIVAVLALTVATVATVYPAITPDPGRWTIGVQGRTFGASDGVCSITLDTETDTIGADTACTRADVTDACLAIGRPDLAIRVHFGGLPETPAADPETPPDL